MTATQKNTAAATSNKAIEHFREAVMAGRNWYISLLEAIGLWTDAEEMYGGRLYHYLIDGEAFDWLLLAERLCHTVNALLPEDEKDALLFDGRPPVELSTEEMQRLISPAKYQQYLNFFYGVILEEALLFTVQKEVRKEGSLRGNTEENVFQETFLRIYGAGHDELVKRFRQKRGYPEEDKMSLGEQKDFTYWLFKHRLASSDKERVASDTKKALNFYRSARCL